MTKHPRQLANATLETSEEKEGEDEYYVTIDITIPYEDDNEAEYNNSGFCGNMGHECHENQKFIGDLNQAVQDGEVSREDADRIYRGKTL